MKRLLLWMLLLVLATPTAFAQQPALDEVGREAAALEAKLVKYKSSSPEAAEVMVQLINLYHEHGRLFGLVRVGQQFVSLHAGDPRHEQAMLKWIDGLQAMSRHSETVAAGRQFLARYENSKERLKVVQQVAGALDAQGDIEGAAGVYAAEWRRAPNEAAADLGVAAAARYFRSRNHDVRMKGAEIAEAMMAKLPASELLFHLARQTCDQYSSVGRPAESNTLALAMLKKNLPMTPFQRRQLHVLRAENFIRLNQHAAAVESYAQARQQIDDAELHMTHIHQMLRASMTAEQMQPAVVEYLQKYPQRADQHRAKALLTHAIARNGDKPRAARLLGTMLAQVADLDNNANNYVAWTLDDLLAAQAAATKEAASAAVVLERAKQAEKPNPEAVKTAQTQHDQAAAKKQAADKAVADALAEAEKVLRAAIAASANPRAELYARYALAFSLLRDRAQNNEKLVPVLRESALKLTVGDDAGFQLIYHLLLHQPVGEQFKHDVTALLKMRRDHLDLGHYRQYIARAIAALAKDKQHAEKGKVAEALLQAADRDPAVVAAMKYHVWQQHPEEGSAARSKALEPEVLKTLSLGTAQYIAGVQADHYTHRARQWEPADEMYTRLRQQFSDAHALLVRQLGVAVDLRQTEAMKKYAQQLLQTPLHANPEAQRRLFDVVHLTGDAELGKQAYAWAKDQIHPEQAEYAGEVLWQRGLHQESIALQKIVALGPYSNTGRACALRLMWRLKDAELQAFLDHVFNYYPELQTRYPMLLAHQALYNEADLAKFEQHVAEAVELSKQQPFVPKHWNDLVPQWRGHAQDQKWTEQQRWRIERVIADMKWSVESAYAELSALERTPEGQLTAIERLRRIAEATRVVPNAQGHWNVLMQYVDAALHRKAYLDAATLLTGMMANITNINDASRAEGRERIAQAYSRLGSVGLTIDENSPLAPLLKGMLYLRLGDEKLAFEAYQENEKLFAEHRDDLPAEYLTFICETLMAAGGEENFQQVEDTLRSWLIKNSESKTLEPTVKAEIQLLLAKNFFKAQRYEIARSEYTTVINRYPDTPQAVEARFGIGETFMAQKVYDQAEQIFQQLATGHKAEIVVRAEFLRGVLAMRRGDTDDAREIFENVLQRVPDVELANQALFSLSEIYGTEQRYLDQLNLLRTVGRLGQRSKRQHEPGEPLSIVVHDSDLGISRGHQRIPVLVTTKPGGDSELVYLSSSGAGKGLFRVDLDTTLGSATPNDRVLQLTGEDVIYSDYPELFKSEFRSVPLSDVEIQVAADATFEISSSEIIDAEKETFSERLQREAREREAADRRVSQGRPANQIKPGNPIYLRVKDADRDVSNEPDQVVVKLAANSGDQVQAKLTETGPHTGVFVGTVNTGELPAGALASDTSINHNPLMAIDRDPASYWLSEPNGTVPKWLTVDMKQLETLSFAEISTPEQATGKVVRGRLLGSNDGHFWFRLASYPEPKKAEAVAPEYGAMTLRVYEGRFPDNLTWTRIAAHARNHKPIVEQKVEGPLQWRRPENAPNLNQPYGVFWHGKLVQQQSGAMRLEVDGDLTAIVVDGVLELPPGQGKRSVDLWLEAGQHDLTVFAAVERGNRAVAARRVRASNHARQTELEPFTADDFNLQLAAAPQPAADEAKDAEGAEKPAEVPAADAQAAAGEKKPEGEQPPASEKLRQFRFRPIEVRYVRYVADEYVGEAVAVSHMELAESETGQVFIPTETDVLTLAQNESLEMAGGDRVEAIYSDDRNRSQAGTSRLLTGSLAATYFDAKVTPITYEFHRSGNGQVHTTPVDLFRIDAGERIVVEITDYDQDRTAEIDTVTFTASVNDGEPIELTATETGAFTGVFTKEIDTSATESQGKLVVQPGDRVICRYTDLENTFPGHAVPRETAVLVNQPTEAQVRVLQTRITPANDGSGRVSISHELPAEGVTVSGISLAAPMTIEVVDPDAAKHLGSKVQVEIESTDGAQVSVECVLPNHEALKEGRFTGQVILQLGGKDSPAMVPLTANMPRNLIGGPKFERQESFGQGLVARVLNLTGKDTATATYRDERRPDGKPATLSAQGRLMTTGTLACLDAEYENEVSQLHVGERIYLRVVDPDQDTSAERDRIELEVTTVAGEKETLTLEETLIHSGVFTGSARLVPAESPTAGNLQATEPSVETYFGDKLQVRYLDAMAASESGQYEALLELPIVVGTDGLLTAFTKNFNNEKLAVETKFYVAESYFELFKSHKALGREAEQKADLEAGRRVLREVLEDYPDPQYAPRVAYLLGQFAQELEQWQEAIDSYELILRQYADHTLAPDAQYKLAQCHEEAGNFDEALEAYVTLAATYPQSPLIASVMIRISDHFYKQETYDVAGEVGLKFLEKFPGHEYAPRMAFRVGQCGYKAEEFAKAGAAFDRFVKQYPDDQLCADALFWSGESYRMARDPATAFQRYNRCRWDFPSSDAAKYARGRLALPEMLKQFETQASNLDE